MNQPRPVTLDSFTRRLEFGALVFSALVLVLAMHYAITKLNEQFLNVQRSDATRIQFFLDDHLNQARINLSSFATGTDLGLPVSWPQFLNAFSDLYVLDADLRIAEIVLQSPSSLVFSGFELASTDLASYLARPQQSDTFSRFINGIEDGRPSLYLSVRDADTHILGRLDTAYIQGFLERYAAISGNTLMLVTNAGVVMLNSTPDLTVGLFDQLPAIDEKGEFLELAGTTWLALTATSGVEGTQIVMLMDTSLLTIVVRSLWIFLAAAVMLLTAMMLFKLKYIQQLVVQPLNELLAGINARTVGQAPLQSQIKQYRFTEFVNIAQRELEKTAYELTENIPVGTYTMVQPPQGGMAYFAFMSTRFLELTGLTREEAQADPMKGFACVHPDDLDAWVALNVEAFNKKERFYGETRVVVDGRVHWITAESIPRTLPDGSTVWEGALADISARKHAEQALLEAKQYAEQLERTKSDFLANMSHEIRTPMNAVLGLTQLLGFEALNAKQLDMVRRLEHEGELLLALIDDVLDMAKIEAGKMQIRKQPFALADLLAGLHDLYAPLASKKKLELVLETANTEALVLLGDAFRLRQVLGNLLSNAIKFTSSGRVVLSLEATATTAENLRLRFRVSDSGIGIAPELQQQLFSAFTQLAAGEQSQGTGLGLAISQRLVKLMGGEISVQSMPGQGSTFVFELAFTRATEAPDAAAPSISTAMLGQQLLAGRHFLVVDDGAINRVILGRFLERLGAHYTEAEDGAQALALLQLHMPRFDAVLMDVQMPVMDGIAATRKIRAMTIGAHLPIIAFTAGVLAEQQQAALAAGMNAVLTKPVRIEALAQCLAQLLAIEPVEFMPDALPESIPESISDKLHPDTRQTSAAPAIAGLDADHLARMTNNDPALMQELLQIFRDTYAQSMPRLQAQLQAADYAAAARLLHSMRGAAAHIGATQVVQNVVALEQALKAPSQATEAQWKGLLQALSAALQPLLQEI